MSSAQAAQEQKQLTQAQSALVYNLPWSEEKTKWIQKKDGSGSFPYRYQMISFDNAGSQVVEMFHGFNLGPKEAIADISGVYEYTVGDSALFKRKKFVRKERTPEEKAQLQADRTGFVGGSGTYSEGAKKGHEENVQMHKEFMQKMDEVLLALKAVEDALYVVAGKKVTVEE